MDLLFQEVPENSDNYMHYMFEKLSPGRNYSIQVRTRNPRGLGPASESFGATAPHLSEYILLKLKCEA